MGQQCDNMFPWHTGATTATRSANDDAAAIAWWLVVVRPRRLFVSLNYECLCTCISVVTANKNM